MARTELTVQEPPGNYPALPLVADAADISWDAADAADKNEFDLTGRELILAWNTDGANPYTVTVESVTDQCNREGDITDYSIGAGEIAMLGPIPVTGFRQSDGKCYLEASNLAVEFAIIRIPS
ncbi:MAG: hypothetical protein KAY24_01180 [Candidatus Eisenbacteria sp.]|nr:hypothetical protein [Candidatus Eisenbacteria bacterium]